MTVMTVVCTIVSISIRVYDFESTVIPYEYWSLLVVAVAIDSYYVCVMLIIGLEHVDVVVIVFL